MKRLLICILFSIEALMLTGCNSGVNTATTSSNSEANTAQALIAISEVSTVPTLAQQNTEFSLLLVNNSDQTLQSPSLTLSNASQDTQGIHLDSSACSQLKAHSDCKVHVRLDNRYQQGYFVLKAQTMVNDQEVTASQLISYANSPANNKDISVGALSASIINASNERFAVAIPLRSGHDLRATQVAISDLASNNNLDTHLDCNSSGNECTILASGYLDNSPALALDVVSRQGANLLSVPITANSKSAGHLLMAASAQIQKPANGKTETTISMLNNGVQNVSLTNAVFDANNAIISKPTCDNGIIAPNSVCSYLINIDSKTSGTGLFTVQYNDNANDGTSDVQTQSLPLAYVPEQQNAGFILSDSAGLDVMSNALAGDTRSVTINLNNSESLPLSNFKFGSTERINSAFSIQPGTCSGTLNPGASCDFTVQYTPTKAEAGNMIIQVAAEYADPHRSGNLSTVSNVLYFNYNTNLRKVFLTNSAAVNGLNVCDMSSDGSQFTNCIISGEKETELSNTNSNSKQGLAIFRSSDNKLTAYVGRGVKKDSDGLVRCSMDESGLLGSCTPGNTGSAMAQLRIANVFGKNYLFTTNYDQAALLSSKGLLDNTTGKLIPGGTNWQNSSKTLTGSGVMGMTIYKKYAYITQINAGQYSKLIRCSIDRNGSWENGTGNCIQPTTAVYMDNIASTEIVKIKSTTYMYIARADDGTTSSSYWITRCILNESDGSLNGSSCTVALGSKGETASTALTGMRQLTYLRIDKKDYLYFGNQTSSAGQNILRTQIGENGTLSEPMVMSFSGTAPYARAAGIVPFISYPSALVQFWQNKTSGYRPGSSYTESIGFSSNTKLTSTNVTLSAPSGISVSPTTLSLSSTTPVKPVTISIGSSTPEGIYTITGTTDNGVVVANFNIIVKNEQVVMGFSPDNWGIGDKANLSTGLRQPASVTFNTNLEINPSTVNNSTILVQTSTNGGTSWGTARGDISVSYNSTTGIANITISAPNRYNSGETQRVILNLAAIKDIYGNPLGSNSAYEVLRFRSALKMFMTPANYLGNVGYATANADCVNYGRNTIDSNHSWHVALSKGTFKSTYEPVTWNFLEVNYYRVDGNTLVGVYKNQTRTFSGGSGLGNRDMSFWTGFDPTGNSPATYACAANTSTEPFNDIIFSGEIGTDYADSTSLSSKYIGCNTKLSLLCVQDAYD